MAERIMRGTLQNRVLRAFKTAGINGGRASGALGHGWRHTFATELANGLGGAPARAVPGSRRPAIDVHAAFIDAVLIADQDALKKQRHTARCEVF